MATDDMFPVTLTMYRDLSRLLRKIWNHIDQKEGSRFSPAMIRAALERILRGEFSTQVNPWIALKTGGLPIHMILRASGVEHKFCDTDAARRILLGRDFGDEVAEPELQTLVRLSPGALGLPPEIKLGGLVEYACKTLGLVPCMRHTGVYLALQADHIGEEFRAIVYSLALNDPRDGAVLFEVERDTKSNLQVTLNTRLDRWGDRVPEGWCVVFALPKVRTF